MKNKKPVITGGDRYQVTFLHGITVYTYFRNWRKNGTWLKIHDSLREWTRIDIERHPSPSEAIIDLHSVKSAAMLNQSVGFDAGKKIERNIFDGWMDERFHLVCFQ